MRGSIGLALVLLMASPGSAAVVGVLDSGGQIPRGADVHYRDFVTQDAVATFGAHSHGYSVIKEVLRGGRKAGEPLIVYAANAFVAGPNGLAMDWTAAASALAWMKEAGASYVCTSFATNNRPAALRFVDEAEALGLKVVASLGNGEIDHPYPALDPRVVAVGNSIRSSDFWRHPDLVKRADYLAAGTTNDAQVNGSSFAAAYECGLLAAAK